MKSQKFSWQSVNNNKINAKLWQPDAQSKGLVAIVHGLGEHLGRYEHVAKFFTDNDYTVMAYDRSGHGESEGKRGHNPKFENYLIEIDELIKEAKKVNDSKPLFLYGHSMGGALTLNYLMKFSPKLNGAVVTDPPLKLAFEPPAIKLKLGRFFRKILPSITVNNELDINELSFNKKNIEEYKKDPLVHDRVSFETVSGLFDATDFVNANADKIKIPLLLMHGKDDGICSPKGTEAFAAQAKGDITLKLWEHMKHEIHNEDKQNEVLQTALDWLNKRC